MRGRKIEKKTLVVIAAQKDGRGIGRIRMRRIPDASANSLESFVQDCIEPGSVVHSDGWNGYAGLEGNGYIHEVSVVANKKESASELFFSILYRGLKRDDSEFCVNNCFFKWNDTAYYIRHREYFLHTLFFC